MRKRLLLWSVNGTNWHFCLFACLALFCSSSVSAAITADQNPVPENTPYTISWTSAAGNWCSSTWDNYKVTGRGTFYTANMYYQYSGTTAGSYTHQVYRKQCYSAGWYYAYVGAITVIVEVAPPSGEEAVYDYDALGRLKSVTKNAAVIEDYDYDPAGNRTSATSGTASSSQNTPPVANADSLTIGNVFENGYEDAVANDTDADGDSLTIVSVTQPANAIVSISTLNLLNVFSTASGSSSFTYTIDDGNGGTATGTVSLTVLGGGGAGGGGGGQLP